MSSSLNRLLMLIYVLVALGAQTYSLSSVAGQSVVLSENALAEPTAALAMKCMDMSDSEAMACCVAEDMSSECCDCSASCASMQCTSSVFTTTSVGLNINRARQPLNRLKLNLSAQVQSSLYRPPITL